MKINAQKKNTMCYFNDKYFQFSSTLCQACNPYVVPVRNNKIK